MTKSDRHEQPAGQMPRHDCHGVHPNQTHEEWLASMKEKRSNISNIFSPSGESDVSGFLGDLGIGGAVGGGATVPTSVRGYFGKLEPEFAKELSEISRAFTGKSLGRLQLGQALRRGGKGALIGGGIAGLLGLLLNAGRGAPFSKLTKKSFDKQSFGLIPKGVTDWTKRKSFDFAPKYFGGRRGGRFGEQLGSLFGMDDRGRHLGKQVGRVGGSLYGNLSKPYQDFAYNAMNNLTNQFGGGMNNKTSFDKQAGLLDLAGPLTLGGALLGGGYGAYKAPGGARPEGFGRGAYRGAGAGLGATAGVGLGGFGGAVLGQVISNALRGRAQMPGDKRYLPALLALLGAGLGGYGGGKLGYRAAGGVTGDYAKLDKKEEEEEKMSHQIQLDFKSASFSDDINEVRALEKRAVPAAGLAKLLGGLGSALGQGISGGVGGWSKLVGKGLRAPGFLPKATAATGGGLSIAALNEMLSSTRGSFLELPHIGMGSDHPLWDPMMQHERIDPKKTGFKSLFHMATRPLQTAAVLTGMAKKPSGLADYARTSGRQDNRLSSILTDPKNFKIDPITGRGTATGEVPFSLDSTLQEQISDFNRQRERLEAMGIVPRRSGSRSTSGRSTHTRPFRGRFD